MSGAFAVNNPPAIGVISNQATYVDQPNMDGLLPIILNVSDAETATNQLHLSLVSSNPTLVPAENVVFHFFPPNGKWFLTLVPAFGLTGTATNTVTVSDGTNSASKSFVLTVKVPPPGASRFANANAITIPDVGAATPYPSTINVTGMNGTITNLTVTLSKINHEFTRDIHVLLVGPTGQKMVVFSRVTSGSFTTNTTATLTDASTFTLPQEFDLWSEQFWPADWASGAKSNNFPPPAPAAVGPYGQTSFSNTFNGLPANGTWSLYVYDDGDGDQGSIAGGWSLMVATTGGSNSAPTITQIANQSIPVNTATAAIPFIVNDVDTSPSSLVLTGTSSNTNVVLNSNINFGGASSNRTVTVTPLANRIGMATITVTVSDGVTNANRNFVLTVEPGQLAVTGITAANKVYDGTNAATINVTGATLVGVVGSPDIALNTGSATGMFDSKFVGTNKTVQIAGLTLTGSNAVNYVLTQPMTNANITPAALTVTANSTNKTYGVTIAFTGTEFNASGLTNSDMVTGVSLSSTGATSMAVAGSYVITASNAVGSGLGNYTINYVTGTLTVGAKMLTVTANNTNKTYGETIAFTGTEFNALGLTNSDTVTSVSLGSLGATNTAAVGSYLITASNAVGSGLGNYTIGYVNGTLVVIAPQPVILSLTGVGTTNVVITWSAASNVTYRLQYKSNFDTTNWFNLVPDITATNDTAWGTDNPGNVNQRFYRVEVIP